MSRIAKPDSRLDQETGLSPLVTCCLRCFAWPAGGTQVDRQMIAADILLRSLDPADTADRIAAA
jgi:hypothetical protein